ncbi:MAG: LysM peptidoglycan-binding domain-containing protein [Planctomycetota bacterium]|jgi:nucleoid-associated protein YgaU
MTSDAKIGLLLGLVFIFIIAFIINGLPNFRGSDNPNKLMEGMINSQDNSVGGIGEVLKDIHIGGPSSAQASERYSNDLPPSVTHVWQGEPMGPQAPIDIGPMPQDVVAEVPRLKRPKIHVVADGESLTSIAKKYYGSAEGNKLAVIEKIFRANRNKLDSVDDIVVGQKLLIPPMSESDKMLSIFGPKFEKRDNIGGKPVAVKAPKKLVKNRFYTVKEDDSLWHIAARELGDGKRYVEITRLNAKVLDDEDDLTVGMKLKLPGR